MRLKIIIVSLISLSLSASQPMADTTNAATQTSLQALEQLLARRPVTPIAPEPPMMPKPDLTDSYCPSTYNKGLYDTDPLYRQQIDEHIENKKDPKAMYRLKLASWQKDYEEYLKALAQFELEKKQHADAKALYLQQLQELL